MRLTVALTVPAETVVIHKTFFHAVESLFGVDLGDSLHVTAGEGKIVAFGNGYELEQALGVADGQGSLACCSPWGRKESDMTGRLN